MKQVDWDSVNKTLDALPELDIELIRKEHTSYAISITAKGRGAGAVRSQEVRDAISTKLKGVKKSAEHVLKNSLSHKGKKLSQETIDKMIKSREGAKRSEATKEKMRAAWETRGPMPTASCSKCGFTGAATLIKRWHNDNCDPLRNERNEKRRLAAQKRKCN